MPITITKADLVDKTVQKIGISQALCETIVNSIFQGITEIITEQNTLKMQNFGIFKMHYKKARFGLNISSMQPVTVKPRKVFSFLASKKLRQTVNSK